MMYVHVHVSEVPDSPVVECTTASALEVARAVMAEVGSPPATAAERESLRAVSGAPDNRGASLQTLQRGIAARYGVDIPVGPLPDLHALADGAVLAVQGDYHVLSPHYQRWDPAFAAREPAGHCVTVRREGGRLLWCDPLAPWGADPSETITPEGVEAYYRARPGARVMAGRATEPPTGPRVRVVLPALFTYTVRRNPDRVVGRTLETGQRIGAIWRVDAQDPVRHRSATLLQLVSGPHAGRWVNPHGPVAYSPR